MQPERLAAFDMILGQSPRLMAAGIVAYGTSQFLNVTIFFPAARQRRDRHVDMAGDPRRDRQRAQSDRRHAAVRHHCLYGVFPIANLMGGQMLAKVALSVLVIPFVITGLVALGRNLDAKTAG